jgi:hypothetical protein
MAELVTEAAKGGGGIAEAVGDVGGREVVEEVGAEGLVLALPCGVGGLEEPGRLRVRQGIIGSDRHSERMLGVRQSAGKQRRRSELARRDSWQDAWKSRVISKSAPRRTGRDLAGGQDNDKPSR